jgi:hypothetical protein
MEAFLHHTTLICHHQPTSIDEQILQGLTERKLLPSIPTSMGG